MRVLIVEDEYLVALGLEAAMEQLGIEVCATAANVSEALDALDRHRPDCVTIDVRLSQGESGIMVAQIAWERWRIRSLFISGNVDADLRAVTGNLNPVGYLSKPVSMPALQRVLDSRRVPEAIEEISTRHRPGPR